MVVKKLSDFTINSILDINNEKDNHRIDKQDYYNYSKKNNFKDEYYNISDNKNYNKYKQFGNNIYASYTQQLYDDIDRKIHCSPLSPLSPLPLHTTNDTFYRPETNPYEKIYKTDEFIERNLNPGLHFERQSYLRDQKIAYYPVQMTSFTESRKFGNEYNASERIGHVRFSSNQSSKLQEVFQKHSYITPTERKLLASKLNLTEKQVKTWFQNKRAKQKRHCSQKQL